MTRTRITFHARGHEQLAHRELALLRANYTIVPGSVRTFVVCGTPHFFGDAVRIRDGWITWILDGIRYGAMCFVAARKARALGLPSRGRIEVPERLDPAA